MAGKFIFDAGPLEKALEDNLISGENRRKIANSIAAELKGALAEAIGRAVAETAEEEKRDIMAWQNRVAKEESERRLLQNKLRMCEELNLSRDDASFLSFSHQDYFIENRDCRYMRYLPPDSNFALNFRIFDLYAMAGPGNKEGDIPIAIETRKARSGESPDCELYTAGSGSRVAPNATLEQDSEGNLTAAVPQGGSGDPVRMPLGMTVRNMIDMHQSIRMYADGLRHSESDEWYMQLKRLSMPAAGRLVDGSLSRDMDEKLNDPCFGLSRDFVDGFVKARIAETDADESELRGMLREMVKNDATFVVIENHGNHKRAVISPVMVIRVSYTHRNDDTAAQALENYAECVSLVTDMPVSEIMKLDPEIGKDRLFLMPDAESDKAVIRLSVRGVNMRDLVELGLKDAHKKASSDREDADQKSGPKLSGPRLTA